MKYLFLLYGKPLPEPGAAGRRRRGWPAGPLAAVPHQPGDTAAPPRPYPEAAGAYRTALALASAAPEREFLTGRLRSL